MFSHALILLYQAPGHLYLCGQARQSTAWVTFVLAVSEEQLGVLICLGVLAVGCTVSAARYSTPLNSVIYWIYLELVFLIVNCRNTPHYKHMYNCQFNVEAEQCCVRLTFEIS